MSPADPNRTSVSWPQVQYLARKMWLSSPRQTCALMAVVVVGATAPATGVYVTMQILNHLNDPRQAAIWLIIEFALFAVSGAFVAMQTYLVQALDQKTRYLIQSDLLQKSHRLPLEMLETPQFQDRVARAQMGVMSSTGLITELANLFSALSSAVAYFTLLAQAGWLLMALPLAAAVPAFIMQYRLGMLAFQQRVSLTHAQREISYFQSVQQGRAEARELRLYQIVDYFFAQWRRKFWDVADQVLALAKREARMRLDLTLVAQLLTLVTSGFLLVQTARGVLTVSQFVAYGQAVAGLFGRVRATGPGIRNILTQFLAVGETKQFLDLEDWNPEDVGPKASFMVPLREGITFNNVVFTYPTNTEPTLRGVSFRIKPGERVALVGPNGAGKSTLIKCLAGLYKLTDGDILFDGIAINDLDVASLQRRVAVMFQDFTTFMMTARENVGLGNLDRLHDLTELELAAGRSGALDIIRHLPQGWDTKLGVQFLGGTELSSGQWQRIALSRAFMREGDIFILDEPSAALDPLAEAQTFDHFLEWTNGKTAIFISHRLSACTRVDRIIVLDKGVVVEEGTHEELLSLGGLYATMFKTQAAQYHEHQPHELEDSDSALDTPA